MKSTFMGECWNWNKKWKRQEAKENKISNYLKTVNKATKSKCGT